ncbi:MAG: hypothetical protein ABIH52_04655 [Candidatus Aenigmatarchaeota archaeon]
MQDMLIRKKALKIQERLGMRIGIAYGTRKTPVVKNVPDVLSVLKDLYRIGIRAFMMPAEMFDNVKDSNDLYNVHYGQLLSVKELASKFNIELSIHMEKFPDSPDELDNRLKLLTNISSIMDCRIFIVQPTLYKRMPQDQALKLVVYKINEIIVGARTKGTIGIETTGSINDLGSLEDVIDIVKRTQSTEVILNWGNIHGRGSGALRTQADYRRILDQTRASVGQQWLGSSYFVFSGVSYGPSGKTRIVPFSRADMNLEHLIREIMSLNMKGTIIFDDPDKDKFILDMLDRFGDMVR